MTRLSLELRATRGASRLAAAVSLVGVVSSLAPNLRAQSELLTLNGSAAGDRFGIAVAIVGDVNNDGHDDFAVAADGDDTAGLDFGSVTVYSGLDWSVLHTVYGSETDEGFGTALSGGGDYNGDGYDDFVVGSPRSDTAAIDAGRVRVYSGFDASVLHDFSGTVADQQFGFSVGGRGDVNADGHADIIVGAPYPSPGMSQPAGDVFVYSGIDGSLLHHVPAPNYGSYTWRYDFGYSVAIIPDLDDDGRDDFVIGSPSSSAYGLAYTHSGLDGVELAALAVANSEGGGNSFLLGTAVDGVSPQYPGQLPRAIVGAPDYSGDLGPLGLDEGNVGLVGLGGYYNAPSLGNALPNALRDAGFGSAAKLGSSVSRAGGFSEHLGTEFVAGAPTATDEFGNVLGLIAVKGASIYISPGLADGDRFGASVSGGGDLNADGYTDVVAGAPGGSVNGADSGYVRVIGGAYRSTPMTAFCFGDGTEGPCPCGNLGAVGRGCANSTGSGALLDAIGTNSAFLDDLVFTVSQGRPGQPAVLIEAFDAIQVPFRDGNLCMGGWTDRLERLTLDAGGNAMSTVSMVQDGAAGVGLTLHYQVWYRDPGGVSPCDSGSNLTNAIRVPWRL